jgi:hypothetical protein
MQIPKTVTGAAGADERQRKVDERSLLMREGAEGEGTGVWGATETRAHGPSLFRGEIEEGAPLQGRGASGLRPLRSFDFFSLN